MAEDSPEAALAREVQAAGELISAALRESRVRTTTLHPFLSLLAGGFERLLKVIVCLQERRKAGAYPDRSIFPAGHRGHGLDALARRVIAEADAEAETARFLVAPEMADLLQSLSVYARQARYHDLDQVLGRATESGPADRHWEGFRTRAAAAGALDPTDAAGIDGLVRRLAGGLLNLVRRLWPTDTAVAAPTMADAGDLASTPAFVLAAGPAGALRGRFPALDAVAGVTHVVTTRGAPELAGEADAPAVAGAARALGRSLGFAATAWMHQVHGGDLIEVSGDGLAGAADALLTDRPDRALLARSADCPLVLLAADRGTGRDDEPPRPAVGIAHASWRSTAAGIAPKVVATLARHHDIRADRLVAAIAPSAGPCCYEVGEEVREAMRAVHGDAAERWFLRVGGRLHLDLWRANVDQLRAAGLTGRRIHVAGVCTLCRNDLFPSHRAEAGRAGRFGALIGIRPTLL